MKSTFLVLGILTSISTAYDCSIAGITALLPAKSIVFYATHYDANATFTPPPQYNTGGFGGPGGGASIVPQSGCIIQGNVSLSATSQYSFGLALPDNWNGRFL